MCPWNAPGKIVGASTKGRAQEVRGDMKQVHAKIQMVNIEIFYILYNDGKSECPSWWPLKTHT